MKKLTLFPIIALAIGILVSCNSAPDMEAMKVKQAAMVDSLVSVGISTKREELKAKCEETVQLAIKAQFDSLTVAATTVGKGTGKTTQKPAPKPAPNQAINQHQLLHQHQNQLQNQHQHKPKSKKVVVALLK